MEQHLADLNRELCKRNRITIVQMQLTGDPSKLGEVVERTGSSTLIKVPLLVRQRPSGASSNGQGESGWAERTRSRLLDGVFRTEGLNAFFARTLLGWRNVPKRPGEPEDAALKAAELCSRHRFDLALLHATGGADASDILRVVKSHRIPVGAIHHFSNHRLSGVSLRQQLSRVDGIGGASLVGVPPYLRGNFYNLSDAVDTDFYSPSKAGAAGGNFGLPVLYAPARVTPEKGQADVLKIAALLKKRGLETAVVFAGRVDSSEFEKQLREYASSHGLGSNVHFLGQVNLETYRDWFTAATVMILPTYHHEGMPRTLIDSQAMHTPPVVYDIGGTREGLKHGETGFLVRLGDYESAASSVESLLRDPHLKDRMGNAGRQFVLEQFSMSAFAARHERFYQDLLSKRKNSSPRN
jgi:glycosyltransferase involved in cell wall biosynthesis